jgi:hypothetical protein
LTVVLSSTSSTAQPAFLAGRYVLPITQHDLYVSAPGPLGTTVAVNFRFRPIGSCTDTLDSVLEYQLPLGYSDTPINEVKATCNKTIRCSRNRIQVRWRQVAIPDVISKRAVARNQGEWRVVFRNVSVRFVINCTPPRGSSKASVGWEF